MRVFISYASEDIDLAERFFAELSKVDNIEPWLDKEFLLPGMDWEYEIMNALEESRFTLILLSKNSVSKIGFVQKEIKEALYKLEKFPIGKIFIIPVRLEDCQINNPLLKKLQWVDVFNDWSLGIDRIKLSIAKEIERTNKGVDLVNKSINKVFDVTNVIIDEPEMFLNPNKEILPVELDMKGVNFMNMNFDKKDFIGEDLSGANFVNCSLINVNFSDSILIGANFERSNLTNVNFANVNLWGVNFYGSNMKNVKNLDKVFTIEYSNFYLVKNLSQVYDNFITEKETLELSDYTSFFYFFLTQLKFSPMKLRKTFKWIHHKQFRGLWTGFNS